MAKFANRMGDPHGDLQTSPQHGDPHGLGVFLRKTIQEVHVDQRVVGWSAGHHGGSPMRLANFAMASTFGGSIITVSYLISGN